MNTELVVKNIRKEFKDYMGRTKLDLVVLGVSGGIDSALIAALVRPVCDELGIGLVGLSLPAGSNKPEEVDRANRIGATLCHKFREINIQKAFEDMVKNMNFTCVGTFIEEGSKQHKIALGNIKARIRMITLYNEAYMNRGLVLSTDNLTEYHLGFWTLHGDVGDLALIQNLWKMEVYDIAKWICRNEYTESDGRYKALNDCILAVPTDGLGITSSDTEQLGLPTYEEVDKEIKNCLDPNAHGINTVIMNRMKGTQYKRENPYNVPRERIIA